MEYRKLPHGEEMISTIGLGLGNIHTSSDEEIEKTFRFAVDHGINLFDLCSGRTGVYKVMGDVIKGRRDKIYTQMHFGAAYEQDTYGFSRDLGLIRSSFEKVLAIAGLGYTDFGYMHCVDEKEDFDNIMNGGLWDYACSLKEQGIVKHLGFSSHSPDIVKRFLDTGKVDMFMFSINPAYDHSHGKYAIGKADERMALYRECEKLGVGITVMKPFAGGQLLDAQRSPLGIALSHHQCIQYALDRPAVVSVLPGVICEDDVKKVLEFYTAAAAEKDYSVLDSVAHSDTRRCVYCNHCAPCPMGLDVGLINKYYDLAMVGDDMARGHYEQLSHHASQCVKCGHCESRCPFAVSQMARMEEIARYFGK